LSKNLKELDPPMLRSYDVLVVILQGVQEGQKLATTPNETSHKKSIAWENSAETLAFLIL
jgi:hypothetical protein